MARSRFRRHRQFPWPLRIIASLGGLWLIGFIGFLIMVSFQAPPNPLPPADGIVVLTGGDDRIAKALSLLSQNDAPKLLISGAGRGTYLGDFTADNAAAATKYAGEITLGHAADSTAGNAAEAALWAQQNNMHKLIIVTASYHMPRALLDMRRAMPKLRIIGVPVWPPAMRKLLSIPTCKLLALEYTKYAVVLLHLDALPNTGP